VTEPPPPAPSPGRAATVAVLAAPGALTAVQQIVARYEVETGCVATVLAGSSDGARLSGVKKLPGSEVQLG
jgi:hypothetical protein